MKKILFLLFFLNLFESFSQKDSVFIAQSPIVLNFTPMSDIILKANQLINLPKHLKYSQYAMKLIKFSYGFSIMYNLIGLSFAIQGNLSPIIAAILMPLNSITLVAIASLGMIWKGIEVYE